MLAIAVVLTAAQAGVVYQDDFSGAAGSSIDSSPEISPPGFLQKGFLTGLDGSGRLESTNSDNSGAGYRVQLGMAPLTDDISITEISYTVTMRTPTNDWIMIGFQEQDANGMLVTNNNVGPVVQFNPTSVVLRGGTYSGTTNGNISAIFQGAYSLGSVITAKMTYHVDAGTMDLSINGTTVTNGFSLNHKFPVGTPSNPVVYWAQVQLRLQPSAANGGGYIDSLQVVAIPPGYAGWASIWGVDIGSETDDYDGDGLSNIHEYGLGGDPTNEFDQGASPSFQIETVDGTNWFAYVHPQLSDTNSGLSYFVELNANLVSGFWTPFGCEVAGTNITGGALDLVTNVTDMADDKKFMRLNIVKTGSAAELRALILKNRPLPLTHLNVVAHVAVVDFGTVADDGLDDRAAVEAAIAYAKSIAGPVQINFDPGTYDFMPVTTNFYLNPVNTAMLLQNCANMVVDGHDASVIVHRQDVSAFWAISSTNLIVRNFSVDYDPLPFSQGTVQSVTSADGSFTFETHAGFPPPDDPFFKNCDSWGMLKDVAHPGRLKTNCPSFFRYSDVSLVGSNLYRIALATPSQISNFTPGEVFVINGRSGGVGRHQWSDNLTFDNITIYACPSSLFVGGQTSQLNVLNCTAQLKGNRLIVSGADGVHCQSARIGPWVENCDFEGLSDDCLNIYGLPIFVLEQISPTQMKVYARASIRPGDRLAFFNPNEGRVILETTVASFSGNTLTLNDPLNETLNIAPPGTTIDVSGWKIYDHAYNLDTIGNHFVYRNNHMHDGRRYGAFIKASDGLVENNVFEGLSLTGMVLENNIGWPEGFWAQNIVIQNNLVSECGYGSVAPCVSIASKKLNGTAEVLNAIPFQKNIFILSNVFNAVSGPALKLSGVDGLVAEDNVFTSGSGTGPLITIQYSQNITLTNNVDQGRIDYL